VGGEIVVRWILSGGGRRRSKDEPPALTLPAPVSETPL
jgi:hypothetical protein